MTKSKEHLQCSKDLSEWKKGQANYFRSTWYISPRFCHPILPICKRESFWAYYVILVSRRSATYFAAKGRPKYFGSPSNLVLPFSCSPSFVVVVYL